MYQALDRCREYLLSFGGHAAAAGFQLAENQVDAFRAAFVNQISEQVDPAVRSADLEIDAEALFSQLTLETVGQLERLSPFGESNPRPLLCASGVQLSEPPRRMGKGERHLALRVAQQGVKMRAVAFGRADWADHLPEGKHPLDLAFHPVINEFNGYRRVELQLVDWRLASVPALRG